MESEDAVTTNSSRPALALLHSEWGREVELVKEKAQDSAQRPITVSKQIDKDDALLMRRDKRWEASSRPIAADDPTLLREKDVRKVIGKMWFLDEEFPGIYQTSKKYSVT